MSDDKKTIEIWKPIEVSEAWLSADTSKLDDIAPSWYSKRKELEKGDADYEEFLNRLKRQHAIETGVVERLYDLSEGITQTFIKEGFVESYLQHGDTDISPRKLMAHLKDHFEAMDFVFDMVKQERPLTEHFIRSLHQLIARHQDYTEAINNIGQHVQVELLKGIYKKHPNNPSRMGKEVEEVHLYCPPEHVESEMSKLIFLYKKLLKKDTSAVIVAAWVHHAFTQIHPFQDGNGRVARMLASLILIRAGLFPLTIQRQEKGRYIDALEKADTGKPDALVELFSSLQKRSIEAVLKWQVSSPTTFNSLQDAARALASRVDTWTATKTKQREQQFEQHRAAIHQVVYDLMGVLYDELRGILSSMTLRMQNAAPTEDKSHWYTRQIISYAKEHDYFFNRDLPRGWFRLSFIVDKDKSYDLITTIHHYSYDDSVMAIGGFLEFKGSEEYDDDEKLSIPLSIEPYTLSLEREPEKLRKNIEQYVRDLVTLSVQHIAKTIIL